MSRTFHWCFSEPGLMDFSSRYRHGAVWNQYDLTASWWACTTLSKDDNLASDALFAWRHITLELAFYNQCRQAVCRYGMENHGRTRRERLDEIFNHVSQCGRRALSRRHTHQYQYTVRRSVNGGHTMEHTHADFPPRPAAIRAIGRHFAHCLLPFLSVGIRRWTFRQSACLANAKWHDQSCRPLSADRWRPQCRTHKEVSEVTSHSYADRWRHNHNQAYSEYTHSLTFRVRAVLSLQRNPCTDCKSAQQCTTRGHPQPFPTHIPSVQ